MILLNAPYEYNVKINNKETAKRIITHSKFYLIYWHKFLNKMTLTYQDGYLNEGNFIPVKSRTFDVSNDDYISLNSKGNSSKNILDDIEFRIEETVARNIGGTVV